MDAQVILIMAQLSVFTLISALITHAKRLEHFYEMTDTSNDKNKLEKLFDAHHDAVIVASCSKNVLKSEFGQNTPDSANDDGLKILFQNTKSREFFGTDLKCGANELIQT